MTGRRQQTKLDAVGIPASGGVGKASVETVAKKATMMPVPPHELPPARPVTRRADDMPIVSEFGKADMDAAIALLQAEIEYKEMEKAITDPKLNPELQAIQESRVVIKKEFAELLTRLKAPGCRWGSLVCYFNGSVTRKTLDKGLLVLNGVTAEQIEASYKESKPFVELRVKDLAKAGGDED